MYPLTIGMLIQDRRLAAEVESVLCDLPVRNVMDENEVGDWTALLERVDALRRTFLSLTSRNSQTRPRTRFVACGKLTRARL